MFVKVMIIHRNTSRRRRRRTKSQDPDLDATGAYWNILIVGNETSPLTTKGDLVYYGGAGPNKTSNWYRWSSIKSAPPLV